MPTSKIILYLFLSPILMIPIGIVLIGVYYVFMKIVCFLFRNQIADFLKIKTGIHYKKNPALPYYMNGEISHDKTYITEYPLSYLDSVLKDDPAFSEILRYRLAMQEQRYYGFKKTDRLSSHKNLHIALRNTLSFYIQQIDKEYKLKSEPDKNSALNENSNQ